MSSKLDAVDRPRRWPFRAAVAVLILALAGVLGGAAWLVWGTPPTARAQATALVQQWRSTCSTAVPQPSSPMTTRRTNQASSAAPGSVLGVLRLPALGDDVWPILVGVDADQLTRGVGWYPSTGKAGQAGNMALAGYRLGYGQPFKEILALRRGDVVIVELCQVSYTYQIIVAPSELAVSADASWVLDAVPGNPGHLPTEALLTLTANQDLLPTSDRAVGIARLVGSAPK